MNTLDEINLSATSISMLFRQRTAEQTKAHCLLGVGIPWVHFSVLADELDSKFTVSDANVG
jgi:hypothetical protein